MGSRIRRVNYNRNVVSCEGGDEMGFLRYLISLYSSDPTNPKLVNGGGGTPAHVVGAIRELVNNGAYAHRYALVDGDRNLEKMEAAERIAAQDPVVELVVAQNRFECEMLKIAGATQKVLARALANSSAAKEEFAKICDRTQTGTGKSYDRVFPKKLLDKQRRTSEWLDHIISIVENT